MNLTGTENKRVGAVIRQLLFTALMVLALKCSMTVVDGIDNAAAPLRFISKLSNSFYSGGITDLLVFFALFFALRQADRQKEKPDAWLPLLSCVFSLCYLISLNYSASMYLDFFIQNPYQLFLSALCFVGYGLLFYTMLRLVEGLMLHGKEESGAAPGRLWRRGFLLIFLCWLPWILMNYPGSFCPDSTSQVAQALGVAPWSDHHPVLSTATMALCLRLGELLVSRSFGCFLYLLLQTLVGALVFSFSVKKMAELGVSRWLCLASLLFFACTPLWGSFAQWYEKDLLAAELTALCIMLLADIIRKKELSAASAFGLAAAVLLAALLRKSGIYELVPALVLLLFVLKKADRRRCAAVLCSVLLIFMAVSEVLYPALGIVKGSVREALSIPFQQTAMYVNIFPDEVTQEEHDAIDAVLDYDRLNEYTPQLSDAVKATYREDSTKLPAYFSVWFRMFLKHPSCYFEAFFLQCSGFIAPDAPAMSAYITKDCLGLEKYGIHHVFSATPSQYFDSIRQFSITAPVLSLLSYCGVYTWCLAVCVVLLLKHRRYFALVPLVPGVMNVLSCIASPMCEGCRYELPLIAATPFIIGWTCTLLRERRPARSFDSQERVKVNG